MKKKLLLGILIVFVAMQLFGIDTSNPEVIAEQDFINITKPSDEVTKLLKTACYDCHSNETVYPWYSQIAPISWWTKHHVDEGKEHLNFSVWGTYSEKRANHKLDECAEEVEEGKMPLDSYTWMHSDAKLSTEQKEQLEEFFKSKMTETHEEHGEEH